MGASKGECVILAAQAVTSLKNPDSCTQDELGMIQRDVRSERECKGCQRAVLKKEKAASIG